MLMDSSRNSSRQPPFHVEPIEAEAFILPLAEALHAYGAAAHRLEGMLTGGKVVRNDSRMSRANRHARLR
jgi:hypothetical protein